jgi:5'-methylthioadenosine phosphorylase
VFERGTYVGLPSPRMETPAEAGWWRRLGGDVAGWGMLPAVTLARELELCVAPVCYLTREAGCADETWLAPSDADTLLAALLSALPVERRCRCGETMAGARARGLIDTDWWKTLT